MRRIQCYIAKTPQEIRARSRPMAVGRQMFGERRISQVAEAFVTDVAPGRAEDRKIGRQQPVGVQSKERRQQHALREIAGGAEEQQRGGSSGHSVLPKSIYGVSGAGSNLDR